VRLKLRTLSNKIRPSSSSLTDFTKALYIAGYRVTDNNNSKWYLKDNCAVIPGSIRALHLNETLSALLSRPLPCSRASLQQQLYSSASVQTSLALVQSSLGSDKSWPASQCGTISTHCSIAISLALTSL
jgi:hypothetical protein